jgi:hypothetical protein
MVRLPQEHPSGQPNVAGKTSRYRIWLKSLFSVSA